VQFITAKASERSDSLSAISDADEPLAVAVLVAVAVVVAVAVLAIGVAATGVARGVEVARGVAVAVDVAVAGAFPSPDTGTNWVRSTRDEVVWSPWSTVRQAAEPVVGVESS
jgi:hypothetical protein